MYDLLVSVKVVSWIQWPVSLPAVTGFSAETSHSPKYVCVRRLMASVFTLE